MADAFGERSLVGFDVGGTAYAIDIATVREIVRPMATDVPPHAPPGVMGVCDCRGELVPVVDLRAHLGVPPDAPPVSARRARWILVQAAAGLVALAVDGVDDVFPAASASPRAVPDLATATQRRDVVGAYAHRARIVFVLDVARLLDGIVPTSAMPRRTVRPQAP